MKNTTLSLSGNSSFNSYSSCYGLSLQGSSPFLEEKENEKRRKEKKAYESIKQLKIIILKQLLIPLITKQWKQVNENICLVDRLKHKIIYYQQLYPFLGQEDLILYQEIIQAFEIMVLEHNQLKDLEKKMWGNENENITTLLYKTSAIRLKPEYEIYHVIFGQPLRKNNEIHNEEIIQEIIYLLNHSTFDFHEIRNHLIQTFPLQPIQI